MLYIILFVINYNIVDIYGRRIINRVRGRLLYIYYIIRHLFRRPKLITRNRYLLNMYVCCVQYIY